MFWVSKTQNKLEQCDQSVPKWYIWDVPTLFLKMYHSGNSLGKFRDIADTFKIFQANFFAISPPWKTWNTFVVSQLGNCWEHSKDPKQHTYGVLVQNIWDVPCNFPTSCQDIKFLTFILTNFTLVYGQLLIISQTLPWCLHDSYNLYDSLPSFLTNQNGLIIGMQLIDRTKHRSIKWSLPQQHPLWSPPPHPLCPWPADCDGATCRGDLPAHRR